MFIAGQSLRRFVFQALVYTILLIISRNTIASLKAFLRGNMFFPGKLDVQTDVRINEISKSDGKYIRPVNSSGGTFAVDFA